MTEADRAALYARLPASADLAWWRPLAAAAPAGRVLYLGCGAGRLGAPLAEVCDELVAVDVDGAMIAAFRERLDRSPAIASRVRLVEADATRLDLGERFGLVVLPSNLLNGIVDEADRLALLRVAATHCRPDGQVVLQVLNPYWMTTGDGVSRGTIESADGAEPVDVVIRMRDIDAWEQRRRATITYRFADGAVLDDDVDAVALYPRELETSLGQAGLVISARWGARPGRDGVTTSGGSWHLVCRPATDASAPVSGRRPRG